MYERVHISALWGLLRAYNQHKSPSEATGDQPRLLSPTRGLNHGGPWLKFQGSAKLGEAECKLMHVGTCAMGE